MPLFEVDAVKVYGDEVAPLMFVKVKPPSVDTCHCRVGAGNPLAAALNDAVALSQTVELFAGVVIAGA